MRFILQRISDLLCSLGAENRRTIAEQRAVPGLVAPIVKACRICVERSHVAETSYLIQGESLPFISVDLSQRYIVTCNCYVAFYGEVKHGCIYHRFWRFNLGRQFGNGLRLQVKMCPVPGVNSPPAEVPPSRNQLMSRPGLPCRGHF